MKHASLFSGIGGFDLAAEWMGWENVFNCEIDPFCKRVLKYHFPNAIQYGDIKNADFSIHKGQIDILTGGFPCQPFSQAGKRKGTEDDRHLWPAMLEVIKTISPRWVVGENVHGIINWDGGLVFEQVQLDLEAEGYQVWAYVLPAVSVNAPHRRDRVWFVAHCKSERWTRRGDAKHNRDYEKRCLEQSESNNWKKVWRKSQGYGEPTSDTPSDGLHDQPATGNNTNGENNIESGAKRISPIEGFGNEWLASDPRLLGSQERQQQSMGSVELREEWTTSNTEITGSERECEQRQGEVQSYGQNSRTIPPGFDNFPTQPPICGGDDGLPRTLDGITFSKWRNESIKAYGNAIVPQVAFQIFKTIQAYEDEYYK